MARDFRHGQKSAYKPMYHKRDETASRQSKRPKKQHWESTLRHAVRSQDYDAFEDYDEPRN